MWKCPKCGEELEDEFDSCWRCADLEPASGSVKVSRRRQPGGGFWCAWRRGWYVLLMIAVFGVVEKLVRVLYQQGVRSYLSGGGEATLVLGVLALAVLVLPPCAYWCFVLFFGRENWPWGNTTREVPREASAFALLEEATKLETRGRLNEALAKYEAVVERFGGTAAGHDAQKSIESLRARIG